MFELRNIISNICFQSSKSISILFSLHQKKRHTYTVNSIKHQGAGQKNIDFNLLALISLLSIPTTRLNKGMICYLNKATSQNLIWSTTLSKDMWPRCYTENAFIYSLIFLYLTKMIKKVFFKHLWRIRKCANNTSNQ